MFFFEDSLVVSIEIMLKCWKIYKGYLKHFIYKENLVNFDEIVALLLN